MDGGASFLRRAGETERVGGAEYDRVWELAGFPASRMGEASREGQPCPQTGVAVGIELSAKEIKVSLRHRSFPELAMENGCHLSTRK